MNTTHDSGGLQAHFDQFIEQLVQSPEMPRDTPADLQQFLQSGFARLLHSALCKERQLHLEVHADDRANGYAPERTLHIGTTPVALERPRTRQGFYPAALPKHQRHLPGAYQQLLQHILLGARSFAAARRTLQALGLGYSPEQMDQLLEELQQEAKTFFTRPLPPDWLCLFADAKLIELKDDQDHVRQAVHFLIVGIGLDGKKELLTATSFWGHEVLEAWRKVLLDLKNRGLVRVLLLVTDDFSGLAPLLQSLFPHTDHQLCCVHLFRNAQRHLSPEDYLRFKQAWQEIYTASSFDSALAKLRDLFQQLRPHNKAFVEHLEKRATQYLNFHKYPPLLHSQLRSTNLPEGLNNLVETLRRNAGGHFHSEREVLVKMKLLADQLYDTRWRLVSAKISAQLGPLTQLFRKRFETELGSDHFLTQNF